jgi:hypothetical protein
MVKNLFDFDKTPDCEPTCIVKLSLPQKLSKKAWKKSVDLFDSFIFPPFSLVNNCLERIKKYTMHRGTD